MAKKIKKVIGISCQVVGAVWVLTVIFAWFAYLNSRSAQKQPDGETSRKLKRNFKQWCFNMAVKAEKKSSAERNQIRKKVWKVFHGAFIRLSVDVTPLEVEGFHVKSWGESLDDVSKEERIHQAMEDLPDHQKATYKSWEDVRKARESFWKNHEKNKENLEKELQKIDINRAAE